MGYDSSHYHSRLIFMGESENRVEKKPVFQTVCIIYGVALIPSFLLMSWLGSRVYVYAELTRTFNFMLNFMSLSLKLLAAIYILYAIARLAADRKKEFAVLVVMLALAIFALGMGGRMRYIRGGLMMGALLIDKDSGSYAVFEAEGFEEPVAVLVTTAEYELLDEGTRYTVKYEYRGGRNILSYIYVSPQQD